LPVVYGEADHKDYILETVGCGCAFFDYDNDGWWTFPAEWLLHGGSAVRRVQPLVQEHNRDGTFSDVTEKSGLRFHRLGFRCLCRRLQQRRVGRPVLHVLRTKQTLSEHGDGTFTDVTKQSCLENSKTRWGAGCTFVDYNRDGHLIFFVSNYVQFDATHIPKPGKMFICNWKACP